MNYKRIYFQLIKKRLHKPLPKDIYGENHHIIPRSFGGSNRKSNLVRLTAREHYLAHFLLYKIFKQRVNNIFLNSGKETSRFKKMTLAFQMMLDASSDNQQRHYGLINSKVFEQLRKNCIDLKTIYSKEYITKIFEFHVKNSITQETIDILNKKFNENFKYQNLRKLYIKYDLKLSDYDFYKKKLVSKKYEKANISEMYNFYIKNNCSRDDNAYKRLQEKFNYSSDKKQINKLFTRNGFTLSKNKFQYEIEFIKKMFDFYIKENLKPNQIDLLNNEFNTDFSYSTLKRLFNRRGFKISDSVV